MWGAFFLGAVGMMLCGALFFLNSQNQSAGSSRTKIDVGPVKEIAAAPKINVAPMLKK